MIKTSVIDKEDLVKQYNQNVILLSDRCRFDEFNTVPITSLEDQVRGIIVQLNDAITNSNMAFFRVSRFRNNTNRNILINKSCIKSVEIQGTIDIITPILERMMPNRWYIDEEDIEYPILYLYYPELTLTNNLKDTHTIYDLVVQVELNPDLRFVNNEIRGIRFSYTQQELNKYYQHSHLSTGNFGVLSTFCTGGGTPFNNFLTSLSQGLNQQKFQLFLLQLQSYLTWESLEGNPYISMSTVKSNLASIDANDYRSAPPSAINTMATYVLKNLTPNLITTNLISNFSYCDPGKDPEAFLKLEQGLIARYTTGVYTNLAYKYDLSTGRYMNTRDEERDLPSFDSELFTKLKTVFNINSRIIEDTTVQVESSSIINRLSPPVIKDIVKKVNKLLIENSKR